MGLNAEMAQNSVGPYNLVDDKLKEIKFLSVFGFGFLVIVFNKEKD